MKLFDVPALEVEPQHPQVLQSEPEGRTIALRLRAGESLQDHETHERAWLVVGSGSVEVVQEGGAPRRVGPGAVAVFDPHERRAVQAVEDATVLLLLTPWPAADRGY